MGYSKLLLLLCFLFAITILISAEVAKDKVPVDEAHLTVALKKEGSEDGLQGRHLQGRGYGRGGYMGRGRGRGGYFGGGRRYRGRRHRPGGRYRRCWRCCGFLILGYCTFCC